mmetsp:Transcript_23557/g.57712  ORF Transcript_23557/g.57712 Transcript_23557/m.57712 type:complete len:820 (+) Transcript_23557:197-2656(+)
MVVPAQHRPAVAGVVLRPLHRPISYDEALAYATEQNLSSIFKFIVNELAEHRPTDWKEFLVSSLDRLPRRQKVRHLHIDKTIRHEISPEDFLGERGVRANVEVAFEDIMLVRPKEPVKHIRTLFEMPFDIVQLHRDGILGETFDEFSKTKAHEGIILKPAGSDWSKEAEAKVPVPKQLSRNDNCYARLTACFEVWDASKSGLLEIDEVEGAMRDFAMWPNLKAIVGSERLDKAELSKLFHQLWADDPAETREAVLDALEVAVRNFAEQYPFIQQVGALFAFLDNDKSGTVDIAEIKPLLTELGSGDISQVLYEAIDIDNSGKIGLAEFEQFLRQLLVNDDYSSMAKALEMLRARLMQRKAQDVDTDVKVNTNTTAPAPAPLIAAKETGGLVGEADLKLNLLFGAWDASKNGFLEEGELKTLFDDIGSDWEDIADRFGLKGGSDHIDRTAFRAIMKSAWGNLKDGVASTASKALIVLEHRAKHGITYTDANIKIHHAIYPDEVISALRDLFQMWDTDKSGFIDSAELRVILADAALGAGIDALETTARIGEDAFVGYMKTLWGENTEAYAGMAVHALRKRMIGDSSEVTGSLVAEAIFGQSELKQRVVGLFERWVSVFPAVAALTPSPSGEEESEPVTLTVEHARELFGRIRKLPAGEELWGAAADKLAENSTDRELTSDEFFVVVKEIIEHLDATETKWQGSFALLENRIKSWEQEVKKGKEAETAVLRDLFMFFDKDDSGALSIAELASAMNAAGIEGDAEWENAGNNMFDLFAEDEAEAKEMMAEEFVEFIISKWGSDALTKAETMLAGAKTVFGKK